jgi:glycosyltransferase involved in cell wall biosynthesis/SAM-dependent methyltransferase
LPTTPALACIDDMKREYDAESGEKLRTNGECHGPGDRQARQTEDRPISGSRSVAVCALRYAAEPVEAANVPSRVLFAYRDDVDTKGGAATVMHRTAEALERLGVATEITYDMDPDPTGFDVVHPVNIWAPGTALEQLRNLRARGATIVWQPFYLGYSELTWAMRALPAVFDPNRPAHERVQLLEAFTAGLIDAGGATRHAPNEPLGGFRAATAEMIDLVDRIAVISMHEAQLLSQEIGLRGTPFTHAPHGVEAERFADASPDAFREYAGLGDKPFVLCVGAIDMRKNQLMLAEAMRGTGLPLVLLGPAFEPNTLELVKAAGGGGLIHIDRVPSELVASAYHAAAVHVLPSWAEGAALANLEAASAGCPIVVSDRSSEFEYFGDMAAFCDPADPASIRSAIERQMDAREREPERLAALKGRMVDLTWEKTARATLRAYADAMRDAAARPAPVAAAVPAPEAVPEPVPVPEPEPGPEAEPGPEPASVEAPEAAAPEPRAVSARLQQFTDGLPWTRQPILDFVRDVAAGIPAGARVLDVGAGEAPYRELFDHTDYVTTDWTHSVHPGARQVDVVGPADDLPIDSESFDFILLTEVLEHTPDPTGVLREMNRILRPGGRLHMTTPFVWELHELPFDFFRYTAWGLDRVLRDAGFAGVDIAPRNDAFTTLAQMMVDIPSTIGSYPDGRDSERAAAIADVHAAGQRIAGYGPLDARRAFPLGYRATGMKAPLPERPAGEPVADARGFVTLAHAGELLFDPKLLRAYGDAFSGDDDATLVIYAPRVDQAELEQRLVQLASAVGMAGEGSADLLALPFAGAAPDEDALAAGVDAVLSLNPPRAAFRLVPHYHHATVGDLRAAAERRWSG